MIDLTRELARLIVCTTPSAFSPEVRDRSSRILADSIGVMVGGARSEVFSPMQKYLAGTHGSVKVLGTDWQTTPAMAALVQGTFGAALDFDDVFSVMPAHPSVLILAVGLVCAAARPVTWGELQEAHVLGLETGATMGRLMTLAHYNQGFHATGTLGVFAAVAAMGRLCGCDRGELQRALGIAASMSAALCRNFGTMCKPLHSGLAARTAVDAVQLARCGLTAAPDALEGPAGFIEAYGAGPPGAIDLSDWGRQWAIAHPGPSLRKFACYNANQRGMQGVLDLRTRLDLNASTLKRLICRMPPGGMQGAIYPRPATGLEAKFSLPYVLAAGILDGRFGLDTFSDAAVRRTAIHGLLDRIEAYEDPSCRGDDPNFDRQTPGGRGFVEVEAWAMNGRHAKVRVHAPPGHPKNPLTWAELKDKFIDCVTYGGVQAEAAAAVFDQLERGEPPGDVQGFLAPFHPARPDNAGA
ncbi:MmgE/PrpD family protein [Candidimonas nitroreducens]|nr:MmgE/PrpD family protein [Candidimonas nitroreducens]